MTPQKNSPSGHEEMKATHWGSVGPLQREEERTNAASAYTQPLQDESSHPLCLFRKGSVPSASVPSSSQPHVPELAGIQAEVNWARRPLAVPTDLNLSRIPSCERPLRPTCPHSQATGSGTVLAAL